MIRKIILIITFFSFSNIYSQNAFYDALRLNSFSPKDFESIIDILNSIKDSPLKGKIIGTPDLGGIVNTIKLFYLNPFDPNVKIGPKELAGFYVIQKSFNTIVDSESAIDNLISDFNSKLGSIDSIDTYQLALLSSKVDLKTSINNINAFVGTNKDSLTDTVRAMIKDDNYVGLKKYSDNLIQNLPIKNEQSIQLLISLKNLADLCNDKKNYVIELENKLSNYQTIKLNKEKMQILKSRIQSYGSLKDGDIAEYKKYKEKLFNRTFNISPQIARDELIDNSIKNKQSSFVLSEAALVEATANIIAEQFKAGIVNTVLNNLITDDINKYLIIFFPKSFEYLYSFNESGKLNTSITLTLRKTINDDLRSILYNITHIDTNLVNNLKLGINERIKLKLKIIEVKNNFSTLNVYKYITVFTEINEKITTGFHPIELFPILDRTFSEMFKDQRDNIAIKNVGSFFKIVNLLQKDLREVSSNNGNQKVWINFVELESLDEQFYKYFFAFLTKDLSENDIDVIDDLGNVKPSILKEKLINFILLLNEIEKNINSLSANGVNKSSNVYETYMQSILNILTRTDDIFAGVLYKDKLIGTEVSLYLKYTVETYKSIATGNFNTILSNTKPLIVDILLKELTKSKSNLKQSSIDLSSNKFGKNFFKYSSFFVDVTTAKNQQELENAISNAAFESGGFLNKREQNFSISVNSYPGFFGGIENDNKTLEFPLENSNLAKYNIGLTTPLGFDISFSKNKFGLFVSIFDIGQVVSYRFNNDTSVTLSKDIKFSQFFSPGIFVRIPLDNLFKYIPPFSFFRSWFKLDLSSTPWTLMVGYQKTPHLRNITNNNEILEDQNFYRYGLFLSYDIPIFKFF